MAHDPILNRRLIYVLAGGVIFLALANAVNYLVGMPFWTVTKAIFLGYDDNISAWYSSMLFIVPALVAGHCYLVGRSRAVDGAWAFILMAGLMLLMSCDEIAQFHETVGGLLARFVGISGKDFAKHTSWVWVAGPIVIVIFAVMLYMLRRPLLLEPRASSTVVLGFSLIVIGGVFLESTINFLNHEELQWLWNIEIVVEESLEMLGTLVISLGLVRWRDEVFDRHPPVSDESSEPARERNSQIPAGV